MSYNSKSKTNWKLLLIFAVLAFFVGGGVLIYVHNLDLNYTVDVKEEKKVQVYLNTPNDTPPGLYRGVLKVSNE